MSTREVLVDLRRLGVDALGRPPAVGSLRIWPTRRLVDGTVVILEADRSVPLVDGQATLTLDVTGPDWAYRVAEPGGITRYVAVPAGIGPIAYPDLVDIDPSTLEPSEEAVPAWTAAVDQVRGYAEDAASLLGLTQAAAIQAEGWADAAQSSSLEADAAAVEAGEHAAAALESALGAGADLVATAAHREAADAAADAAAGSASSASLSATAAAGSAEDAADSAQEAADYAAATGVTATVSPLTPLALRLTYPTYLSPRAHVVRLPIGATP